jgi:hypothetical protein
MYPIQYRTFEFVELPDFSSVQPEGPVIAPMPTVWSSMQMATMTSF